MSEKVIGKFTRNLVCELTQEEFNDRASQLAALAGRKAELEQEQEVVKAGWKKREADIKSDWNHLSRVVGRREEVREVTCEAVGDYLTRRVTVYRRDTGLVVEERAMTEHELQANFDFSGAKKSSVVRLGEPN
jgi:hypothetical protein